MDAQHRQVRLLFLPASGFEWTEWSGESARAFPPACSLAGDPERDSDHGTLCWEIGELLALASSPP